MVQTVGRLASSFTDTGDVDGEETDPDREARRAFARNIIVDITHPGSYPVSRLTGMPQKASPTQVTTVA